MMLTEAEAIEVYDILVEFGGAPLSDKEPFVHRNTTNRCAEYLCLPRLGIRGQWWRLDRKMVITCAGAESSETLDMVEELNRVFDEMMSTEEISDAT